MISALDRQLLVALVSAAQRANCALKSDDTIFHNNAQGVLDHALMDFELKSKLLLELVA